MDRRTFIAAMTGGLLAAPLAAKAEQTMNLPRIGYLSASSPSFTSPFLAAFREGLRDLGYVEGQNIAVEYRWAQGIFTQLPKLAADLVCPGSS